MEPMRKWKCSACDELHDNEDDARECCPPSINEVYVCPVCGSDFPFYPDALMCCDCEDRTPTTAELEQAGQMRILP